MKRIALLLVFALASLLSVQPVLAQTCSFTPLTSTPPVLTGRLAYQDDSVGQLYLYDFAIATRTLITQSGWSVTLPRNPIFSPNGKAIIFSADQSGQRDLYYWVIGAANPTNLTVGFGSHVNEDPHFSPLSGKVVWKKDFNIWVATLQFDGSGNPSLTGITQLTTTGVQGTSTEASDPNYSPSEKYIYFYTGVTTDRQLQRYNTTTHLTAAIPKTTGVAYYYPVDVDLYDFQYVSWLNATNTHDKIYFYSIPLQSASVWNATDCDNDNSDPAPADENNFIYSRFESTGYQLYIGQFANSANVWNLSALNTSGSDLKGSNYTNAR